jgi:type I restriction enzyme, S subunit
MANPSFWTTSGIPWVSAKDMKASEIHDTEDHITEEAVVSSATNKVPAGTVLMVTRSGILRRIFPVAISRVDVAINQDLKALIPSPGLLPDYVLYALRTFGGEILHRCSKDGTTVQSVEFESLLDFLIPIAPSGEQGRIVRELDARLSEIDAAVATLKRVQANLKRYRASVLKAACEGRLVPTEAELARKESRTYETGEQLLARILKERRAKWEANQLAKMLAAGKPPSNDDWRKKYKEPVAPDKTGLPELPDGWAWGTVEQVSDLVQYGSSAKCTETGDIPVLRMGNLSSEGSIDNTALKFLPRNHAEFPELLLRPGDLLFNRTNSAELVGKSAVYAGTPVPCSFASYLIRVRTILGCDSRYLAACLNSSYGKAWVKAVVNQQVGQANVNGTKLQAFVFPLPPESEQTRIVQQTDQSFSTSQVVEHSVDDNLIRADRLRQAILKRAFEGKLVPQDPNDEPASVLLERIRAERLASRNGKPQANKNRARRTAAASTQR